MLEKLLIVSLASGVFGFIPMPKIIKKISALLLSALTVYINFLLFKAPIVDKFTTSIVFLNTSVGFTISHIGLYFSAMITSILFLTVLFSFNFMDKKNNDKNYYSWLFIKSFGMIGVVFSGDFLTLFFMWEFMSWSTFFLMKQGENENTDKSSSKYMIYAIISGMVLMLAVTITYSLTNSFEYASLSQKIATMSIKNLFLIASLFTLAFAIEAAAYPLHLWVPNSYANTFTPITAFLAGISTRMGIFGILFILFKVIGVDNIDKIAFLGKINFRYILGWIAAFTIVIPTFTALLQNDGKKLMTWHGIGQGGYMLLGFATGSSMGIAGGMFHILNHLTYITLIILSLAAVEYRTGTTNLNRLGGLIKKQPIAFLGVLIGIIGLAGIPPMNGFVSKWYIYRALILGHYPFLAVAAFIGTLGTILSVYKFIHNIFLGRLPKEYENVKEAPITMTIPILILMVAVYSLGVYPGVVFSIIAKIELSMGIAPVDYTLNGIASTSGQLNMFIVNFVFMVGLLVAMLIFLFANKRKLIPQNDNYAAGHFVDDKLDYNFNYHFYASIEHILRNKLLSDISYKIEHGTKSFFTSIGDFVRGIYTGNIATYSMYIITAVLALFIILENIYGL